MKKKLKISFGLVLVLALIWFSLDVQQLDKHKAAQTPNKFEINAYVNAFWTDSLPLTIAQAPNISEFLTAVQENQTSALEKYGRKLGISKTYYCFVKGVGVVESIENEYVNVAVHPNHKIKIAIDFIYGNAVRDGSGKVNINTFLNMTDFNNVSVAINKLIKQKVVMPFKNDVKVGQEIKFAGAMELNAAKLNLSESIIIPVLAQTNGAKN